MAQIVDITLPDRGTKNLGALGSILPYPINKSIAALRPFERDPRSIFFYSCEEKAIEPPCLLFQHTHFYLHTIPAKEGNAPTCHLWERILHRNHYARYPLLQDEFGTRGCFSIVRAGLKTNVQGALSNPFLIFGAYRCKAIYLSMRLSGSVVIALPYNPILIHKESPHKRIGRSITRS